MKYLVKLERTVREDASVIVEAVDYTEAVTKAHALPETEVNWLVGDTNDDTAVIAIEPQV